MELFSSSDNAPILLSLYIDEKMRTTLKETDADGETIMEKCVNAFKYLKEKDSFEKSYVRYLGKRLLGKKTNVEFERSIVQKFKHECGSGYTDSMEQLFKDIDIAMTVEEMYADVEDAFEEVDATTTVLKSSNWQIPRECCRLPESMQSAFAHFVAFYHTLHAGRRVDLRTAMGLVEINATFGGVNKILIGPTILASLLDEFNRHEVRTFEQLLIATEVPELELKRLLKSVSMGRSRHRIMNRRGTGSEIGPSDEFLINDSFTSNLRRVTIQLVSSGPISKQEDAQLRKEVEDGRKVEIQAAIVRVMKARQTIAHNLLIVEVVGQLSRRFQPDQLMIKSCIESLIDKEYMSRRPDDQRTYTYTA